MYPGRRFSFLISRIILLVAVALIPNGFATAQVWTVLAADPKDDGREPSLADAATLSYRYDKEQDILWFRISLFGTPNEQAFGANIVVDTSADEVAKLNWWGANKSFRFDRLVTAWVTRTGQSYRGTIGISDSAGIKAKQFNNLSQGNLQLKVEGDSILIGVKPADLSDKPKMKLIAAVGSKEQWNDDIPGTGSVTLDLSAARPKLGLREIDLSRNNFVFDAKYKPVRDDHKSPVTKIGHGPQKLILVPGMYSGKGSFDQFTARNQNRYTFYELTPPGVNGTLAHSMPATGSFSALVWTRLLERDILDLIRREHINKPVLIAESYPASIAAINLAVQHPDRLAGVVIAGTNIVQYLASPKDATRKTPATLLERISSVDEAWGAKWFKYVTPETWNSNDMRPEMLSSDLSKGQRAWQEIEAAPLPVKVRYLCEFWASDVTLDFNRLRVPVMALVAGFDEKFLADPANIFTKLAYVDSWTSLVAKYPKLQLTRIPGARLLIFEDQSGRVDEAMAKFVQEVTR